DLCTIGHLSCWTDVVSRPRSLAPSANYCFFDWPTQPVLVAIGSAFMAASVVHIVGAYSGIYLMIRASRSRVAVASPSPAQLARIKAESELSLKMAVYVSVQSSKTLPTTDSLLPLHCSFRFRLVSFSCAGCRPRKR